MCPISNEESPGISRRGDEFPRDLMARHEFDSVFDQIQEWGTWSDPDRGAFNRISNDTVLAATTTIQSGRTVQMALAWDTVSGVDNARPALHHMVDLGDREAPEPSTHKDFIAVDYHGKAVSHLDALSHIAYRDQLFNGVSARERVNATGAHFGAVTALGHFVGRGVLIDMPVVQGVDWLEPGAAVHAGDLEAAERALGVNIGAADAVLLRTGHKKRRNALGPWDSGSTSAGWDVDAMPLLASRQIALLGADGDSDVRPSRTIGIHSPIHILAITAMGVPLLDNLDLESLSTACAEEGRYEFLFVVAPLNVPFGTGSPVNPLAIF